MDIIPFNFDASNLEIVPPAIAANKLIVYHGTSDYYSTQIETNGFRRGYCPFDLDLARKLVALLRTPAVRPFDPPTGFIPTTLSDGIDQYIGNIRTTIRISFSPLSSRAAVFAIGDAKGGQIFGQIRSSHRIINACLSAIKDREVKSAIEAVVAEIQPVFDEADRAAAGNGVVYVVQLPETLERIEVDLNNVVYSNLDVPITQIIGKVAIPADVTHASLNEASHLNQIKAKLNTAGGIRSRLNRAQFGRG
jgi:hypothetical protein